MATIPDRLVDAAARDEPYAVNDLVAVVWPIAVAYAQKRIGYGIRHVTPEDIAQEVCVDVLRALPAFAVNGGSFIALVMRIASCNVIDAIRRGTKDQSVLLERLPEYAAHDNEPETLALRNDDARHLHQLLPWLPPMQRHVITLRYLHELTGAETAAALGITAANGRVIQNRGLKKLRELAGR